jgi:NhaP-type Na+/H+ or K+/H+ antiporter
MNAYIFLIGLCVVIITSFFFGLLAKKTNIPSVILLIFTGIGLGQLLEYFNIQPEYFSTLEILGIVGLIMIVLEAALDLELTWKKWPIIWKSFMIAFVLLTATSFFIAFIIRGFMQGLELLPALIYAIPLSIMSSAIIIPSVSNLSEDKREFMVYESTFSDILGIMAFYLLLENMNASSASRVAFVISSNIFLTIVMSVLLSYLLVYIIQYVRSEAKFFLFLAVLVLLYAVAKLFHFSSLLIILSFGLLLRNYRVLLFGKLKNWFNPDAIDRVFDNFKMITVETSFLIRTFFFVVFGMSMSLETVTSLWVWLISISILVGIYFLRYILHYIVLRKNIFPQVFIAPRGLISILLFYAIPEEFQLPDFESGVLFVIIIVTSIIMAWSLIANPFSKNTTTMSMSETKEL